MYRETPTLVAAPRVLNMCCKVDAEKEEEEGNDEVQFCVNNTFQEANVTSMQRANITKGEEINTSICKGTIQDRDNTLRIVAASNVRESLKLLSR
jgi:hypothetical protein